MDFGALPPEVNSARMYAGAGAAPLLAAAAAWNGIADALSAAASSIGATITRLSNEHWMGPASLAMVAAAQPLLAWLTNTAESSAHAGSQALASAAAFETAFAMTVPPADVAANRAVLADLIATNILGHNVSAIAATEARYGEMWAQDASAMYGYASSSAMAGRLNPLIRPSGQAAAASAQQAGLGNLISQGPHAVLGLASPAASAAHAAGQDLGRLIATLDTLEIPWLHAVHHNTAIYADWAIGFMVPPDDAAENEVSASRAAAAAVGLGNAHTVGSLSVPPSWSTAAPATTAGAAFHGTGWAVPGDDEEVAAMPPAPGMVVAADTAGTGAGPRYGVKPTVMPKRGLF